MTLHHDDDDFKLLESRGLAQEQQDYWASVETNEQILEARKKNPPRRGSARKYGKDGVVDTRMSQTEVALRLARHLAESPLLGGTVYVQIGGAEVNRRGAAGRFRYLTFFVYPFHTPGSRCYFALWCRVSRWSPSRSTPRRRSRVAMPFRRSSPLGSRRSSKRDSTALIT
jgi:hypothetical protein